MGMGRIFLNSHCLLQFQGLSTGKVREIYFGNKILLSLHK
jgi:hypothetical protein